jgi:hypothetical protein
MSLFSHPPIPTMPAVQHVETPILQPICIDETLNKEYIPRSEDCVFLDAKTFKVKPWYSSKNVLREAYDNYPGLVIGHDELWGFCDDPEYIRFSLTKAKLIKWGSKYHDDPILCNFIQAKLSDVRVTEKRYFYADNFEWANTEYIRTVLYPGTNFVFLEHHHNHNRACMSNCLQPGNCNRYNFHRDKVYIFNYGEKEYLDPNRFKKTKSARN